MSIDYDQLRRDYRHSSLNESEMGTDPVLEFDKWFQTAIELELELPNAMVVATVDERGRPAARYVLLKSFDAGGFVFFTHAVGAKGRQLAANPFAALVFYWGPVHRQVRVEGRVEQVSDGEADAYFASRPYGSRIAVWAAEQSTTIASRDFLEQRVVELEQQYPHDVPRPAGWTGFRVIPDNIEFWQGRENRLHDRIVYSKNESGEWHMRRLAP